MASVYVAQDERLGRRVAIKVLADSLCRDPEFVTRFQSEAEAAATERESAAAAAKNFNPDCFMVDFLVRNGAPAKATFWPLLVSSLEFLSASALDGRTRGHHIK